MNIIIRWLCLVIVGQLIHSKVITINNNGSSSTSCCTNGFCVCNSLPKALLSIENDTVITITSHTISLHIFVQMTLKNNVTITGSDTDGAFVMCNNTGAVFCDVCSNFTIEAITWDRCGVISYPIIPGITFIAASNISIINSTFQQFGVCNSVSIAVESAGSINVVNSKFMFNTVSNVSLCKTARNAFYNTHSSLHIISYESTNVIICGSLFYQNGNTNQGNVLNGSLLYIGFVRQPTLSILVKNTSFISNEIKGVYIHDTATRSKIIFNKVNISDNRFGATLTMIGTGYANSLNIISSHFVHNNNGALLIMLGNHNNIKIHGTTFASNKGTTDTLGTALYIYGSSCTVNMSLCSFYDNVGGNSIVHITELLDVKFPVAFCNVSVTSSNFTGNKIGSALHIVKCYLKFYSTTVFQDNFASSGVAIYIAESSQITVDDGSTVQFINNTALLRGGAMYMDLTNCYDHGVVFTNLTGYNSISFINNSAKFSGNSIYFNIPDSCSVVRDYAKNNSAAYVPYNFNYTQAHNIIGPPITASPYEIKLVSPDLMNSNNTYVIKNDIMLGQSVYFNPIVYDYFNAPAEVTMFIVNCINCGFKYKLLENQILVQNGSKDMINIISVASDVDVENDTNITLSISSLLSPEYRELTMTLLLTVSSCNNGFLFSKQSQQCECYNKNTYLQCDGDSVSIKLGYWFGVFSGKQIFSLCHFDYCNFFTNRKETRSRYYDLPEEIDDQCSSHRTGVACGQCSEGYTLAYNSPECISVDKCSPGMIALIIVLTTLYWIAVIVILFAVAYGFSNQQASLGYLYSITYFYSIVDILLSTNLHVTDGVSYTAKILSSFAKLNPQFLGTLCFTENLDGIDQQFIHYFHAVFTLTILIVIYITAKCNNRALLYVNRSVVQVTCFVLLFSYTSLTSASLLLLRALTFDDIDGLYTYLSPHLKYFANRHALYASVAILCVLLVTIGFPLLLIIEPLMINDHLNKNTSKRVMQKLICFVKIKPLIDQLQDCYKDRYHWFAAYYLICRLVIMLITYFANDDYNYMIFYLQTACVVITMIHIWIQPHKNDVLNAMDTVILLIMLLVISLSAFNFSTATTAGIALSLMFVPLLLLFGVAVKNLLVSKIKRFQSNLDQNSNVVSSNVILAGEGCELQEPLLLLESEAPSSTM